MQIYSEQYYKNRIKWLLANRPASESKKFIMPDSPQHSPEKTLELLLNSRYLCFMDFEFIQDYREYIGHEICSIGAAVWDVQENRQIHKYYSVTHPIMVKFFNKHVMDLTHLTKEDFTSARPFKYCWKEFMGTLPKEADIHNAFVFGNNDASVLKHTCHLCSLKQGEEFSQNLYDISSLLCMAQGVDFCGQEKLAQSLEIENISAHNAYYDALTLCQICVKLLDKLKELKASGRVSPTPPKPASPKLDIMALAIYDKKSGEIQALEFYNDFKQLKADKINELKQRGEDKVFSKTYKIKRECHLCKIAKNVSYTEPEEKTENTNGKK